VETYYSTKEEAKEAQLKGYKSKIILQIDYCAVSIEEVVLKCTHLLLHRQNELAKTLEQTPTLFDGKLKEFDANGSIWTMIPV